MSKRRQNDFNESARLNNYTYNQYLNRLTELSMAMFEWENLPDSIDARFLELTLFTDGACIFFKDEELGFLALQCIKNGSFNVYRIPVNRQAFAVNGYNKSLNDKDSVIIWNNLLHTNSILDCRMFARRLYNLDRAIDVNCNAQKTPILLQCDEKQRLTLKNVYMQYDGNMPVIFSDKNLDLNGIKAINTGAPFVSDRLYTLKVQYWNEALTYLGISNVNFQKKERLISDEVSRSQGGTIANRYSRLEARRQAADEINRMFGLNISVKYRDDFREADEEYLPEVDTENEGSKTDDVY